MVADSWELDPDAKAHGLDVEAIVVEGDHFTAVPEELSRAIAFFRAQK